MAAKLEFWAVPEVAGFLGVTPTNVRVLTHRGRLKVEFTAGGKVFYDADLVREYGLWRRKRAKYPTIDLQKRRKARQFPR